MEDQIVYADATEEVVSEESPLKKLLKKEQRLLERLHEEQEAETEAQGRYRRAKARLQRKRKRVQRFQRKLTGVREELAALQITDQHPVYKEPEVILVPLSEETLQIASEEDSSTQPEEQNTIVQETVDQSQADTEYHDSGTSRQELESTSTAMDAGDVPANDGHEGLAVEEEVSLPQEETTTPTHFTYEPIEVLVEPAFEANPEERSDEEHSKQQEINFPVTLSSEPSESTPESEVPTPYEVHSDVLKTTASEYETAEEEETGTSASTESIVANDLEFEPAMALDSNMVEDEAETSESDDTFSETNVERRPTKPLQVEQPASPATVSHDTLVQSAKEAWIAAESAMQRARNTVNGINASIAILSQTEGLSMEFMEELTRKQAAANRELLHAQDAARTAYEHFVQAQQDAQSATSQAAEAPVSSSESSSRQNQEDTSLPPAEENGLDQTATLHATGLYTEW